MFWFPMFPQFWQVSIVETHSTSQVTMGVSIFKTDLMTWMRTGGSPILGNLDIPMLLILHLLYRNDLSF